MADRSRRAPEWARRILARFGRNPKAVPVYRVIWSETRLRIADGRLQPEYGAMEPQWVLERWCAPELYGSPEDLGWQVDPETGELPLGPFPRDGDYEFVFGFGKGTPINPTTVELICRLIEAGRAQTRSVRWRAIKEREERAREEWRKRMSDEFDDAQVRLGAVAGIPSKRLPEDVKIVRTAADLPRPLQKPGFVQLNKG